MAAPELCQRGLARADTWTYNGPSFLTFYFVTEFMTKRARTPCIGICSTALGGEVCRGCKRFAQEVIDWNGYSNDERLAVLDRVEQILVRVVRGKFDILDGSLLQEQIRHQQIRCDFDRNPFCWIFDLLRAGAGQIQDLTIFGIRLKEEWSGLPLPAIRDLLDQEFYEHSCAYYDRYIVPAQKALNSP